MCWCAGGFQSLLADQVQEPGARSQVLAHVRRRAVERLDQPRENLGRHAAQRVGGHARRDAAHAPHGRRRERSAERVSSRAAVAKRRQRESRRERSQSRLGRDGVDDAVQRVARAERNLGIALGPLGVLQRVQDHGERRVRVRRESLGRAPREVAQREQRVRLGLRGGLGLGTVPSLAPNEAVVEIAGARPLKILDYPGHVSLRPGLADVLARARKVVVFVDSTATRKSDVIECAELLRKMRRQDRRRSAHAAAHGRRSGSGRAPERERAVLVLVELLEEVHQAQVLCMQRVGHHTQRCRAAAWREAHRRGREAPAPPWVFSCFQFFV